MLSGTVDLELTPEGRIGLNLDGLVVDIDGSDGMASPSASSARTYDFAAAARHSWHRRRDRFVADCMLCVDGGSQSPLKPRLEPPSEGLRLDQIEVDLERPPPSDSLLQPMAELIDLDRPDVAALRAKRWKRLTREGLALLDRIAADPRTGADSATGQAWSAAVIRDAPRGAKLLERLEATYRALAAPAPPSPPSEEELREASVRRRAAVMASFKELVERDEANGVVRSIYDRLAQEQPQGP